MKVIKEISKKEFTEFLYKKMNVDDSKVIQEIENPNYIGIFQLTGKTARELVKKIKPKNFSELNACNALSRPGPIENVPLYVANKNGAKSDYPEKVQNILKESHNIFLFQEQIMKTFQEIGNFSLNEANEIRGLMKKLGKADKKEEDLKAWDKAIKKFKKNAVKNNISEKEAERITNDIVSFASYSFNKSHSVGYSYIATMCLYLSVYFRKFYYASVLQYEIDRDKELLENLKSISRQNFKILPPSVNYSKTLVSPGKENNLLLGLSNLKGVGTNPAEKIIENRKYNSIIDFILKLRGKRITATVIKALIQSGAFDEIIEERNRKMYLNIFEEFHQKKGSTKVEEKIKAKWQEIENKYKFLPNLNTTEDEKREWEKNLFGFIYFNPIFNDQVIKAFEKMYEKNLINMDLMEVSKYTTKTPVVVNNIKTIYDKNDNEMAFLKVEDMKGEEASIPVFASYWKYIKDQIISDHLYLLNLFRTPEGDILFGTNKFVKNENIIRRMVKVIK